MNVKYIAMNSAVQVSSANSGQQPIIIYFGILPLSRMGILGTLIPHPAHLVYNRPETYPGPVVQDSSPKHLLPNPDHIIKHHSWSNGLSIASVCNKMRDCSVEVAKPGMAQVC
jgi:hypothetical protein